MPSRHLSHQTAPRSRRVRRTAARSALLALVAAACLPGVAAGAAFNLDMLAAKARKLAEAPWEKPVEQVPEWLLKISYDQWRDIRFRPEVALWRDRQVRFQVQLFHPGLFYNQTVGVSVVDGKRVRRLQFSPSQFDYGKNDFASRVPQDLGYAGLRVHHPIKTRNYFDEVIVFLGASYFRAVGTDEVFGVSARGLAVDTAESWGEEFPYFRDFWLVTPPRNAEQLAVYALLDSPSLTGAYRFVVDPGVQTTVKVECRLFLRKEVRKIGVAPLTSMFFRGENTTRWFHDFRPEVHDSDGLMLHFKHGEWLWRPLDNPRALDVSSFQMTDPRGFGLVQRDREFAHYQDLETRPERRPSVWIAPANGWGAGRVEIVQIPTNDDHNDNVVMYWVPAKGPKPGEPARFSYTMSWYGDDPGRPPAGRVVATRRGVGTQEGAERFVVDFAGKELAAIPADRVLRGVITVAGEEGAGELLEQHVVKNPVTGGWRLTFQVRPKKPPVELRAFLDEGGETLTETWSYVLLP